MYRRFGVLLAAVLGVTLTAAAPATADASRHFPTEFSLPNGWQPEGIAIAGTTAYFGSRADGSIYAADLRTGRGKVLAKGPGTPSLGQLLSQGKANIDAWWISLSTFGVLVITLMLLTFMGDALRDALDPRKAEE